MRLRYGAALLLACLTAIPVQAADSARDLYTRTLGRERVLRDDASHATLKQMRRVVVEYEAIVRRYPRSGYSDNALWQAGNLAALAYQQFNNETDRRTSLRLLDQLEHGYPSSSLVARVGEVLDDLAADARPTRTAADDAQPARPPVAVASTGSDPKRTVRSDASADSSEPTVLRGVRRTVLPDGVRVTMELDSEPRYHAEELESPHRVFFDLQNVRVAPELQGAALHFEGDVVKEIRLGRHPNQTTRVVLDTEGTESYSVYPLYNPYRLVVDFRRLGASAASSTGPLVPSIPAPAPVAARPEPPVAVTTSTLARKTIEPDDVATPLASKAAAPPTLAAPSLPAVNSNGKFSLSRQLGLGVARVVIDAGHGGHDPGAQAFGVKESDVALDVALRLRKLLEKEPGIDVVMTRDSDVFIPLQERTAIANRAGADLFLSIHVNASRNSKARGIETYFLNFATNPEAEAVAARENSASGQSMHSLPDIVKAIALNNKIDESRDFADMVQKSMVRRVTARNQTRDLGVKQAPFVVLIGAVMPSVLAEISFVTHRQEGLLLKSSAYKQQIAEALLDAVMKYQESLKKKTTKTAARGETDD